MFKFNNIDMPEDYEECAFYATRKNRFWGGHGEACEFLHINSCHHSECYFIKLGKWIYGQARVQDTPEGD